MKQKITEEEMCKKIFFDLDGTLAEFKPVSAVDSLYEKNYFLNLKPHEIVVRAFKKLEKESDIELYILSSYLTKSKYALDEKIKWIKKYISSDFARAIFVPYGDSKAEAVEFYTGQPVDENCYLIDDYNLNLYQWEEVAGKGRAMKLINDCNDKKGSWRGIRIYQDDHCFESIKNAIS